jgi:lipopolysaccharide export LptBFGC system permease protein LptF
MAVTGGMCYQYKGFVGAGDFFPLINKVVRPWRLRCAFVDWASMVSIVDRYLAKQLLFACFIATLVFSGPAILISLFSQLPNGYIFSDLLWPSLATIAPLILYQVMPLVVACAIVWCYGGFASERVLVVLHLAGQSIFRVRAPALYVATGATLIGYAMSFFIAPLTAGHLHDVLRFVRHDINPVMLHPARPNILEEGRLMINFKKFLGKNEIADVFIWMKDDDDKEQTYVARRVVFERNAERGGIVLFDGSAQEFDPKTNVVKGANFDQLRAPLTTLGATYSKHRSIIDDELSTLNLFLKRSDYQDPVKARNWTREVVKRFSIPILTIIHTLLGLELLALRGIMTDRRRQPTALICSAIAAFHVAIVMGTEQIGLDLGWLWATAAMISVELAALASLLLLRPEKVTSLAQTIASYAFERIHAVTSIPLRAYLSATAERIFTISLPVSPESVAYAEDVAVSINADGRRLNSLVD